MAARATLLMPPFWTWISKHKASPRSERSRQAAAVRRAGAKYAWRARSSWAACTTGCSPRRWKPERHGSLTVAPSLMVLAQASCCGEDALSAWSWRLLAEGAAEDGGMARCNTEEDLGEFSVLERETNNAPGQPGAIPVSLDRRKLVSFKCSSDLQYTLKERRQRLLHEHAPRAIVDRSIRGQVGVLLEGGHRTLRAAAILPVQGAGIIVRARRQPPLDGADDAATSAAAKKKSSHYFIVSPYRAHIRSAHLFIVSPYRAHIRSAHLFIVSPYRAHIRSAHLFIVSPYRAHIRSAHLFIVSPYRAHIRSAHVSRQ